MSTNTNEDVSGAQADDGSAAKQRELSPAGPDQPSVPAPDPKRRHHKFRVSPAAIRRAAAAENLAAPSAGPGIRSKRKRKLLPDSPLMFMTFLVVDFPLILIVELLDSFDLNTEIRLHMHEYASIFYAYNRCLLLLAIVTGMLKNYKAMLVAVLLVSWQSSQLKPVNTWITARFYKAKHVALSPDTWRIAPP